MPLTSEQKAAKWKSGTENGVDTAQANVNAMTQGDSPAQKALDARQDMVDNFTTATAEGGKWEQRLSQFVDITKWQPRMVAGLERNRNLTDAQTLKIKEHFDVQGYATGKIGAIIALIDATGNGYENTPSYSALQQKLFINIAINANIDLINQGDTAQEILNIIGQYLIDTFSYTATP